MVDVGVLNVTASASPLGSCDSPTIAISFGIPR